MFPSSLSEDWWGGAGSLEEMEKCLQYRVLTKMALILLCFTSPFIHIQLIQPWAMQYKGPMCGRGFMAVTSMKIVRQAVAKATAPL